MMLVNKADIQKFIPLRAPMVMVDQLLSSDENQSTTTLKIKAENIFFDGSFFTEPGLVENMAQTAALGAGFHANQKNEKVKVGFIGAVKNLTIHFLPEIDTSIETTITMLNNFGNISIVQGKVKAGGKLLAECEMSIFAQDENEKNES